MIVIPVAVAPRGYSVLIDRGLLARSAELLQPYLRGRAVIVADARAALHLATLEQSLTAAGISSRVITLAGGEATKSWASLEALCEELIALGVERSDHVIALGGGVIGDLVGFACSILKRGCDFVQVPTTLLAQVDSSVGGKTAINAKGGKNLIGSFHQPSLVLIDPDTLTTLPSHELRAGYAEVVKYGLINDAAFFGWCEAHGEALLRGDAELQIEAIAHSVRAKAAIVVEDERETRDVRALLNLGHTFGHALEAETGFSDRLLHGEAVAAGCALAFRYSARRGLCSQGDADRVATHLRSVGLPASLGDAGIAASGTRLVDHMRHDKKMAQGTLPFLLARGIGETFVARDIELADVAAFLDESE